MVHLTKYNFFGSHAQRGRFFVYAKSILKIFVLLFAFLSSWFTALSQRQDISLNENWLTSLNQTNDWKQVNVPHNWDDYHGYRRLLHGNLHGDAIYKKTFIHKQPVKGKKFFLYFEGVGSYATVFLNGKYAGEHAGGRTTFTLNVTDMIHADGSENQLEIKVSHPANIKDLPWVCGGCSDERGFSEGSQPLGIFRPVHLIVTNDLRIVPFGVHAWADVQPGNASLSVNTTLKNYLPRVRNISIIQNLVDAKGKIVASTSTRRFIKANDSITIPQHNIHVNAPVLWSDQNPYLYKIVSVAVENNAVIDKLETDFGFRTINWRNKTNQLFLNNKPVFLNGIAEYEHLLGQSHAFSREQVLARVKWIQLAGFNAFRDGHQPHHLLYGKQFNQKGILWWTQLSAHVWYDTKAFRDNFKKLLREWVIERRNDPSVVLWGLQNESKIPADFAAECTELIRSLDPTASSQRLVTTCNGGEGTDWNVPQNWTGTYGGNPATYDEDVKKQVLIGEYGAWRTLDLHTEGGFVQNGILSEDRMTQLMEQKVRLAESVKDSSAGHFFWLLTSHDNPGRVQGGEGLREIDRIGPVNYKGMLTPWEEPTDVYYMYRSNYASKEQEPMVYIASHTWPGRWMTTGIKDSIFVYSNCDEVELFNDVNNASLGKQKRKGIGTHFQWDKANILYNVLYAVGYVNGKAVARDTIVLNHLPKAPNFEKLYTTQSIVSSPQPGFNYLYRINCGSAAYVDVNKNSWEADTKYAQSWTDDFENMPKQFASQRRTFSPIKGTRDWKLFQDFRYGRHRLSYNFPVPNGQYLVELFFVEPWLGIGGGTDATGMRLFDIAVNGKTVIKNLDIWKEVGTNTALKKQVSVTVTDGKIDISFPSGKAGQALISAIAIAKKGIYEKSTKAFVPTDPWTHWLDLGDKIIAEKNIQVNALPSNLFGASWLQGTETNAGKKIRQVFEKDAELFFCITMSSFDSIAVAGLEKTNTEMVTDENGGTVYLVYKKRFKAGDSAIIESRPGWFVCMQPVNEMQPAYDLKPVVPYRAATATKAEGTATAVINKQETISFTTNNSSISWNINIGAADIYSVTLRYLNASDSNKYGRMELIMADGTIMTNEKVTFTPSRPGKWNYISTNTGSMINAGNYRVRIVAEDAVGVGVSGLDIQ